MGVAAFSQTLTQADRDKGSKYLEQTRDAIVAATSTIPIAIPIASASPVSARSAYARCVT